MANHTEVERLPDVRISGAAIPPIAPYDFKHPKRADRRVLHALSDLHEDFARQAAASLSTAIHGNVQVRLLAVEQCSFGELLADLDNPTCISLLKAEPLPGHALLEIHPAILQPMLDCMLGGGSNGPTTRGPLTEVELRLVRRITGLLCDDLRRAWAWALDLRLDLVRVESNPRVVQVVPAANVVVLVRFELLFAGRRGRMNLCLPGQAIQPIREKLVGDRSAGGSSGALPETAQEIGRAVRGSRAEVKVVLAETRITADELIGLRVGDIITTPTSVASPLTVAVEGIAKFRGRPGAVEGSQSGRHHRSARPSTPFPRAASSFILGASGLVAQRLEQGTHNPLVAGSNPAEPIGLTSIQRLPTLNKHSIHLS